MQSMTDEKLMASYQEGNMSAMDEFIRRYKNPMGYQNVSLKPSGELLTVKLRYKEPNGDASKLLSRVVGGGEETVNLSENFKFATSVAEFGLLLRNSEFKANASYQNVLDRAKASKGADADGYRADFIRLVDIAQILDKTK